MARCAIISQVYRRSRRFMFSPGRAGHPDEKPVGKRLQLPGAAGSAALYSSVQRLTDE
jgi:hypothetical protein